MQRGEQMTSIMELNEKGEKFLKDQLKILLFADDIGLVFPQVFIDQANFNIVHDINFLQLPARLTRTNKIENIEFTKDHLKFKDSL